MSDTSSMDYLHRPRRFARVGWWMFAVIVAGGVLLGINETLSQLSLGVPEIDRRTVLVDTVERGTMTHEVRAPGTLTAEIVNWIPAMTDGRVARIASLPGVQVNADTLLLELRNPDLQLALADAQAALASAQATVQSEEAVLQNRLLQLEAETVALRTQYELAQASYDVGQQLFEKQVTNAHTLQLQKLEAEGLKQRLDVETRRFELFRQSVPLQTATAQAKVLQAEAALKLQQARVEGLKITAGIAGVLEQVPVEVGQQILAGENLARVVDPRRLKAVVKIPEVQSRYVQTGQTARIDTHHGIVTGIVSRIDPGVHLGTVSVDVMISQDLPAAARPELSIIGTIEIERLSDVLFVGRPVQATAESTMSLFRVDPDDRSALRVPIDIGVASVSHVEVRGGAVGGDRVILTDMSRYEEVDVIHLK